MIEHTSLVLAGSGQSAVSDGCVTEPVAGSGLYVSVVMPCFNEERFIGKVLQNLAGQYNSEQYEIIVVDGMSVDGTREVVSQFATAHPETRVRLVDNPARNIPTALNTGIRQARGDVIVRMDAHSVPSLNYVCRCVELLSASEASVVGMPWRIRPGADTATARAIALAVAHPFGIGDAKYRMAELSTAQYVDTVPFGAFRKALWEELGGFNEELLANEDYDFYYRARRAGGRVLLDTSAHCLYFARVSLTDLARQYFRYGVWKAQMVKLHPRSIKWRQLVAPAFVSSLLLLTTLSLWWPPALWALIPMVTLYVLLSISFAVRLSQGTGNLSLVPVIFSAFFVIHSAWGSGFLLGIVRSPRR